MIIRKANDRGHINFGWLDTYHTFSFGDFYDPQHMGFGDLRVINDDKVGPVAGFPSHSHKNMEIITYILDGVLEHKDSMGNTSQIKQGDVQRMSAGSGVVHSEYNPSPDNRVHLLQIWVMPSEKNKAPSYEQKHFTPSDKTGKLRLIGSTDGRDGSVTIGQDISMYAGILNDNAPIVQDVPKGRIAWLHVAKGQIVVNDETLSAGDAVSVDGENLTLTGGKDAEILLFEMAA